MAKRIAAQTIVLHRAGKRITVKPGQQVDLSDAELSDINRTAPDALRKIEVVPEIVEVKLPPADKVKVEQKANKHDSKPLADTKPATTDDDI